MVITLIGDPMEALDTACIFSYAWQCFLLKLTFCIQDTLSWNYMPSVDYHTPTYVTLQSPVVKYQAGFQDLLFV